MASQALYLKWRPQRFEDVVGQDHVTTTLKNALRGGRVSHAYLFSGPRGTGKTTMARLLAKAVNCLDEDVARRPCNQCRICRSINEGRLLDLIEMDAASHTGVDNVRDAIRDKVGFRPTEARYKVYVIDEVHMLSTSAFNALLKTLEEPPEHVIFCLATTEPHKVLPTILSRCQHFEFHRIALPALVARLQYIAAQEGLAVEEDALQLIARMAAGSARDAISLLDQLTAYGDASVTLERVRAVLGLSDAETVHALLEHLAARDLGAGLDVINEVVSSGADIRQFAQQVVEDLRAVLLLRVGGEAAVLDVDAQTRARLRALVGRYTTRALLSAIKLFNQAQLDLRASDQSQLALELAYIEAAAPEDRLDEQRAAPAAAPEDRLDEQRAASQAAPVRAPQRTVEVESGPVRARASVPPPAPPRATPEPVEADEGANAEAPVAADEVHEVAPIRLDEIESQWDEIRHAIRAESRQVEALVNSSLERQVEGGACLVIRFASELLASKLQREESRRVVERVLHEALGRRCRVRAAVGASEGDEARAPVQERPPVREAEQPPAVDAADLRSQNRRAGAPGEAGLPGVDVSAPTGDERVDQGAAGASPIEQAASDPVVQDLLSLGGQVTDVQVLSDE